MIIMKNWLGKTFLFFLNYQKNNLILSLILVWALDYFTMPRCLGSHILISGGTEWSVAYFQ